MFPPKLKKGDTIAVIAPSRSTTIISEQTTAIAIRRLEELGFRVVFSPHKGEKDEFLSSSVQSRIEDIHWAFSNKNINGILTVLGGYNTNQLLNGIDFNLIESNPKVFCGYSDITAIQNAIYRKTGLVTYYGPHFSSFGMEIGLDYTIKYFQKCLMEQKPFTVEASKEWSDDQWYIDQKARTLVPNEGPFVINHGEAKGTVGGGNLCTLNLLQGTEFMPNIKGTILFLEDDYSSDLQTFGRDLQSLIHQKGFEKVRGIAIGRFQKASRAEKELLIKLIKARPELKEIPVVAGLDFGHTTPQITLPLGGKAKLTAKEGKIELRITKH
jgi:muramoyltetrapeptide carboxypeptidase